MNKKHPKKANGARTVQENMKRKYQEEAWREMANAIQVEFLERIPYTILLSGGENVHGHLYASFNEFMASKNITPKED